MKRYALGLSALSVGAAGLVPVASLGQQDSGGVTTRLTFEEQLRHEDDDTVARTGLGLDVSSATATQSLRFNLSTALDADLSGDDSLDVQDPLFGLGYTIGNRSSELALDLSFRRQDVDESDISLENGEILVIDEGEREDQRANLALTFGQDAPFGGTVALNYAETSFIDGDPTLLDSERLGGSAQLNFRLTPTITSFVALSASDLDRDGGTDVEERALSTGLQVQVSRVLTTNLSIGVSRVETEDGTSRTEETGGTFGLGATLLRPNGTISGDLASEITENGRRTTLTLNRVLALPSGSLTAGVGLSRNSDTDSTDPLYSLSYDHALRRSTYNASLSQRVISSTTGDETLASQLDLTARYSLSDLSSLTTSFNIRDTNVLSGGGADSQQIGLSLSYDYQLTRDWSLFTSLSSTRREQDGQADDTDEIIAIGIRSAFTWRR